MAALKPISLPVYLCLLLLQNEVGVRSSKTMDTTTLCLSDFAQRSEEVLLAAGRSNSHKIDQRPTLRLYCCLKAALKAGFTLQELRRHNALNLY